MKMEGVMRKFFPILIVLFVLISCGQPGELPMPPVKNNTVKGIPWMDYGVERFRAIEMVCYIDTSLYSPLNALDYTLEKSGIQFFDYVILGGAYLKKDGKGFYLDFSDGLMSVLARKNRLIVPLQKKGIKVLLGIESQGNASLGNVNEDEMGQAANDIYTALQMYWLDGVEFYDNADPAAYPPNLGEFDPDDVPEDIDPAEWDYNRWLLREWEKGGDNFNNFFYTIRYKYDAAVRETVPMLLREKNYGSYLPDNVSCTSGFADFASSVAQITYSFNIDRSIFKEKSDLRYKNGYVLGDNSSGESWVFEEQYGPFFLEMDGGENGNVYYPQSSSNAAEGGDLLNFILEFKGSESRRAMYQAIYIHNLKAESEARDDPFYKNVWYKGNPGDPDQTEFEDEDEFWEKSKYIPPVYIFSQITQISLGDNVVCSGGNHLKDW
jgi:predicted small lipoprotein YifL